MRYIKELLIVLSTVSLSGAIVGLSLANLIIIFPAIVLMISCTIGACIAEEMEGIKKAARDCNHKAASRKTF